MNDTKKGNIKWGYWPKKTNSTGSFSPLVASITTSYVNQYFVRKVEIRKLKGTIARAGEYGGSDKEEYHCKSGMIEVMWKKWRGL